MRIQRWFWFSSFVIALFTGGHARANLITEDPFTVTFITELEMTFTDNINPQQNYSLAPQAKLGSNKQHTASFWFNFSHAWEDASQYRILDSFLQFSTSNLYELFGLKWSLNNRVYFPTSSKERDNSEIFNWRIWTGTSYAYSDELSFNGEFRIQFHVYEFATRQPVSNSEISYMSQNEARDAVRKDSLNDMFSFRPKIGMKYMFRKNVTLILDAAIRFLQTYDPPPSSVVLNPTLTADFYGQPFFAETLSIGLTDSINLDLYCWQVGKVLSSRNANPFSPDHITFFSSLSFML